MHSMPVLRWLEGSPTATLLRLGTSTTPPSTLSSLVPADRRPKEHKTIPPSTLRALRSIFVHKYTPYVNIAICSHICIRAVEERVARTSTKADLKDLPCAARTKGCSSARLITLSIAQNMLSTAGGHKLPFLPNFPAKTSRVTLRLATTVAEGTMLSSSGDVRRPGVSPDW
ncbi:hypothetical protein DENSPDRAFT_316925 [Dentipellis sp. KUC8613]|nr:hypothetical protein DENSPDRAFT_316925 [Dentipellis sp. KUC8613]